MIDLTIDPDVRDKNAAYCREKGITLPTLAMMQNPEKIPEKIKHRLKQVGLWDLDSANLFRITWKNEQKGKGGLFNGVNHLLLPPELTGCPARIICLTGKWFPTGAHKVGATYGCLAPALVTGQFDPQQAKAVWPSTGNYCRGGAYISALLASRAVAILPEEMSRERFEWLQQVAGEVMATPGCESNVKEIFDKCWELRRSGQEVRIFNQFDEMGNPLWHYAVTGRAVEELLKGYLETGQRFAGYIAASGSGGTLGAGYYLKTKYPRAKLAVAEALQCPTLMSNGFGGHRIEGIGDKHVPWVHDCKETDVLIAVDDEHPVRLLRLFNEDRGRDILIREGVDPELVSKLDLLGISGIANLLASIKFARYFELTSDDYLVTVATDSMELYSSRIAEFKAERGEYRSSDGWRDVELLMSTSISNMMELGYHDRKRVHNLKYFTWIEQQGKELEELNRQWYEHDDYWPGVFSQAGRIDELITAFNERVGL
ncbi:MAG: pyridoxal-phosphate dependent enzyme [Desulfohalobiaceae bacterium]|nr:pyridoxal-phosphate dependent enzyme [Desulfohalobiaceae bacterium]